jgi:hypothetical protein
MPLRKWFAYQASLTKWCTKCWHPERTVTIVSDKSILDNVCKLKLRYVCKTYYKHWKEIFNLWTVLRKNGWSIWIKWTVSVLQETSVFHLCSEVCRAVHHKGVKSLTRLPNCQQMQRKQQESSLGMHCTIYHLETHTSRKHILQENSPQLVKLNNFI